MFVTVTCAAGAGGLRALAVRTGRLWPAWCRWC